MSRGRSFSLVDVWEEFDRYECVCARVCVCVREREREEREREREERGERERKERKETGPTKRASFFAAFSQDGFPVVSGPAKMDF